MTALSGLAGWQAQARQTLDEALQRRFDCLTEAGTTLPAAMRYATLDGGKRLRGLLVLAAAKACGHAQTDALSAACAVEAMHAYSLVHDDLPCMDDDAVRRGKPSCHVQFGEPLALLTGDALQSLAFEWLVNSDLPAESKLVQVACLSAAAGAAGMAGGQAIDLVHVGKTMELADLKNMHALKTGALIRAAVRMGAVGRAMPAPSLFAGLDEFAQHLGLAFQVVDDILDVETDSATLGKTSGKDQHHHKPTMVSLLGLTGARTLARDLHTQAQAALRPLGDDAWVLRALADQLIERKS